VYRFSTDSVQVFETPTPVNSYYLPYDISSVSKPLYAEPFTSNVSFPTLAQDIYSPAGSFPNTIFGGDILGVLGFGFTATTTVINDTFSSLDFPILLEADFFNRSSFGNHNESYFWIGNANYTHFNPSNSILPSPDVQQGIIIGGLPDRTIISNGRNGIVSSVALLNQTHNLASYNNWNTMKVMLDVLDDGRLVIYNVFINENCVLSDPIIVEKSSDLNLNRFKLAICVDDFAKEFKVTQNADLFQLPDVSVCENGIISLSPDFAEDLCLDFNYFWDLPGSEIGNSNQKSPLNVKYTTFGVFESKLTVTSGQFNKIITFNVTVESAPNQLISQTICSNDSIFFNNQWIYSSGLYQEVWSTQQGCDSTITLDLIFIDTVETKSNLRLCQGDSILINNQWIYDEGNFTIFNTSTNGCDSLSSITVEIIPQVGILDTINLCQGDSILLNNRWYYGAQDVTYFDFNAFCPINISTAIVGKPNFTFLDEVNICPNDSTRFQGNWINEGGSFSFNYKTQAGCDSVYTLIVSTIPLPIEPVSSVDCDDGLYDLAVSFHPAWSYQWSNGAQVSPTTFSEGGVASISFTHREKGCLVTYSINLPFIPDDNDVPFFGDTIVYPGKPLKYMIAMDSNFWSLDWYQDNSLQCEDCFVNKLQTTLESEINLIFYHISGCEYLRDFSIGIDDSQDLYIPNIFAPESTSGNDKWRVNIPECFTVELVKIYDRWGNLVSASENPKIVEWDGVYKGNYLEQGVYTYLILFTDPALNQKIKSGDITLLR